MPTMILDDCDGNGQSALPAHPESTRVCDRGELHGAFSGQEALASLLPELELHRELDLEPMRYHLEQSDATTRDGYWHASINEARSFLEALLVGIMHAVEGEAPPDPSRNGSPNGTPFRSYRRYLTELGFLDPDENTLLQFVYGVASAKGSHHGVADEAWSRLARRMVCTTGQYVIHRYGTWKSADRRGNGRGRVGHPEGGQPPPNGSGWHRLWGTLLRSVRAQPKRSAGE